MSRQKSKKVVSRPKITRNTIYEGDMSCPICGQEVSAYRVACFLEKHMRFKDFVGKCPICRK